MDACAVARQFLLPGAIREVRPYGAGNVNDTFLVSLAMGSERYILQRLNPVVFPEPGLVMANLSTVAAHLRHRIGREAAGRRWEVPEVIPCRGGADFWSDDAGVCWRLLRFIDNTLVRTVVTSDDQAREVGYGLGRFHRLLSDLDPGKLHDTLPGFHITPGYLAQYDRVAACGTGKGDARCGRFVEERRHLAPVLEKRKEQGLLPERVMHGDPKADNFLLDADDGRVVSLVDLDTVKPGLIHYDLGDCLRSCCNPAGEEGEPEAVDFDIDRCRAILQGYLGEAAFFLIANDYAALYDAVRLIAFELGLRFYADHLAGNRYFKAADPEHNLRRALVQFRLVERIEARERTILALVDELR